MIVTEQMRIDPAYRARLLACGLDSVTAVLTRVDGRVAAWSRTTDTLYVPGPDGDTPGFYIKRHLFPGWIKRLRGTFRGTFFGMHRGHAEYLSLNAMRALGIAGVRPVAYGVRRAAHFLTACFLITEEVPDSQNLTSFAQDVVAGRRPLSRGQRLEVIGTLATQLAALHATGFSHGNLFWRNVLLRTGPDGRSEFFFLDVRRPRLRERLRSGGRWWLRELAQVAVSALSFTTRAERLRFLRQYFDERRLSAERKAHAREIDRWAATWRRHEDRRIRMNDLFDAWNRQLADEQRQAAEAPAGHGGGGVRR